jgi:hypothetical protein
MRALALALLLGALTLGASDLRRTRRSRSVARARWRVARRIAARYDRSRPGRRLATRLWRAQIHMSAAGWRSAQLLVAVPAATALLALGIDPLPAFAAATTAIRIGGAAVLWSRRTSVRSALDGAAPVIARGLATELAAWGSGAQAICGAASRCGAGGSPLLASRVLEAAAARVILGGEAAASLHRAIAEALPGAPASSPSARVAAVFALHRHDAASTAAALDRLATALDDGAAARREAQAAVAEVRMSAAAVPVIAAATLGMLLVSDPPALAAALSLPVRPILATAAILVVAASAGVRRLVSV